MTEQEFYEKLKTLDISFHKKEDRKNHYIDTYVLAKDTKKKIHTFDELYLYKDWRTGGVGGGSCWDNGESNHYAKEGNPEPEFVDLDTILENLAPEISYLKYKKFMKELKISELTWTENEYYGNSTAYCAKLIKLTDLFNTLQQFNLV
jgi:hypothetical protein